MLFCGGVHAVADRQANESNAQARAIYAVWALPGCEWIENLYVSFLEVGAIAGCNRQLMNECRCRDEAVFDRHRSPLCS